MKPERSAPSPHRQPPTVLIVEDDPAMAVALRDGFQYEGYGVRLVADGASALRQALETRPDLIILDVMLPRMNGLEICRQLRDTGNDVPIIMLTARGQEVDKIQGLKIGADDYVTKPFSFLELMARVEAVLRRSQRPGTPGSLELGEVSLDFRRHEATRRGEPLDLSPREFAVLEYLVTRRGEVVTREQLLQDVWGYERFPFTRTVDMHIAKLRRKIEPDPADPTYIVTVHGTGYKFTA
jgi:DNA-binding response OmpR family regulator